MKSFIQMGQQEGKANVWCLSPCPTLRASMSCLEYCLFNPLLVSFSSMIDVSSMHCL